MKKLLLLGTLALASMTSKADVVETYLDPSLWTVTACSWIQDTSTSGHVGAMLDDDLSTYYHQSWTQDTGRGTHWFIVDMGVEQEIHGVDIWGRQNHVNGHILEGKIYASTTPFENFADHDAAKAYYDDAANVPVAEIHYEYSEATRNDVQASRFDAVNARYILVLTDQTSQNQFCVGEFKVLGYDLDRIDIDRTNWVATVCSEAGTIEGAAGGYAANMFDDNLSTYYHQNWSSDHAADAYHWIMIDFGKEEKVSGFKYWRRQNNANGEFLAGKVYVSNEPFTAFTDHDAAKAYHDDAANVPAGEFSFNYDVNPNNMRLADFDKSSTGRYALIILSDAGMNNGGRHMCCSELKFFTVPAGEQEVIQAKWENGIDHAGYAAAGQFLLLQHLVNVQLPASTDMPADVTIDNVDDRVAEFNANVAAFNSAFNNLKVTIKNAYRRANNPYLAAVTKGNGVQFNTLAEGNPDTVWEIQPVEGGFRLYNRTTGYYIGGSQNPVLAANAQVYTLRTINDDYIAFAKGTSNNLLNIDSYSNNLTQWSDQADQGSSWIVSLATAENCVFAEPEVSTAEAPKYYRIVNARWMAASQSPCMAVNGENQDGSGNGEQNNRATAIVPGIYWRVESANEEGGVKLVNLTGYEFTFDGSNATTLTDNGSVVYLIKQTDAQFNGYNVYGISSTATASTGSCLDSTRNSGVSKVQWNPTNDGVGNGDNGSAWYFIPASDDEIATATQAYVNSVVARGLNADSQLDEIFGEGFAAGITPAYDLTVAGVNAAKYANHAVINEAVNAKVPELANRHFLLRNCNTSYANCYMTVADDATAPTADATDMNALWSFVPSGEGFLVTSAATGNSIAVTNTQSAPIPVVEEGLPYSIAYNAAVQGFNITLLPNDSISDVSYYAIHQSNNTTVCKWIANNIAGSHWKFEPAPEAEVEVKLSAIVEGQDTTHYITLPEGVEIHPAATAEHVITITLLSQPEVAPAAVSFFAVSPVDGVHTVSTSDFVDGTATLTGLKEGQYKIEAPAGMFLVNGKPSAAVNSTFYVSANGEATGIKVVTFDGAGEVIFDLQGRRANGSAKGLIIVNGKKTLRK